MELPVALYYTREPIFGLSWTRLGTKTAKSTSIVSGDYAARTEADRAAWHIWKATDLPARARRIEDGKYAVEIQISPQVVCEECRENRGGVESYPGECCPCESVVPDPEEVGA